MQRAETVKQLGPWTSQGSKVYAEDRDCETVRTLKSKNGLSKNLLDIEIQLVSPSCLPQDPGMSF